MRETILKLIEDLCPAEEIDGNSALIDDGIMDSFDVITLVSELNEKFDVEIGAEHIVPENFNSVELIEALIIKLQEE